MELESESRQTSSQNSTTCDKPNLAHGEARPDWEGLLPLFSVFRVGKRAKGHQVAILAKLHGLVRGLAPVGHHVVRSGG